MLVAVSKIAAAAKAAAAASNLCCVTYRQYRLLLPLKQISWVIAS
jgi:hypothetical protein